MRIKDPKTNPIDTNKIVCILIVLQCKVPIHKLGILSHSCEHLNREQIEWDKNVNIGSGKI